MVEVEISYGKKNLTVQVPEKNLLDYACLPDVPGVANEAEAITRALKNPIEMESLEKLAAPGQKIAIIVDDITRPTPTHKFLAPIVEELESAGIKDEDITVVFATGSHRPHTNEEKQFLLGAEYASRFKTIDHDAKDKGGMVSLGQTSRGTPVEVNKHVAGADLKILTGVIKPHS
jgi:nickel-dependent lactate racemase